ncbi:CLIP domain-containing serine protease B9 [Drosophila kikkawai]|uniref:CLIP domain-containing serine protease B9 n=1 Tax=Drosophila kikkawai TaxID=30033 RepID=A0ABM3C7K8_DROKI|nr:CLIP domain-containing serine protease B9 [Drosophila kikkawai]
MKIIAGCFAIYTCLTWLSKYSLGQFLDNNCGYTVPLPPQSRVYGGRNAIIGSSPWMAYLIYNSAFHCGGTLITRKYILTAAHCIANNLKVRLGEYDTKTEIDCTRDGCIPKYKEYDVSRAIIHANYSYQLGSSHDIGLLKLAGTVSYEIHIRPVCILLNPARAAYNPTFVATGWGKTDINTIATVLQVATLRKLNSSECNSVLRTSLTWGQFCAGHNHADTCEGDSGGPLVQMLFNGYIRRTVQFGIVSYGHYLCRGPGVYTDVMAFTEWIRKGILLNGN